VGLALITVIMSIIPLPSSHRLQLQAQPREAEERSREWRLGVSVGEKVL